MLFNAFSQKATPVLLSALLLTSTSAAFAERVDTVITAPGMKVEKHQGWFGSGKTTYSDGLGNRYSKRKGWFGLGGEREESKVFGTQLSRQGDNVNVTAPNGTKLVEYHKSWFGLGPTRREIHADRIWDVFKNIGSVTPTQQTP